MKRDNRQVVNLRWLSGISGVIVIASMTACVVGDPHSVFVDDGKLSATIVLSTAADRPCVSGTHTEIVAAAAEHLSNDFFPSGPFRQMVNNSRRTLSDFRDHFGQLYTFPVAPGQYFMIPYLEGELDIPALTRRKYRFSAAAGETVYIGEFHLSSKSECDLLSMMEVRDESDRDLAAMAHLKPGIANGKVVRRIANGE